MYSELPSAYPKPAQNHGFLDLRGQQCRRIELQYFANFVAGLPVDPRDCRASQVSLDLIVLGGRGSLPSPPQTDRLFSCNGGWAHFIFRVSLTQIIGCNSMRKAWAIILREATIFAKGCLRLSLRYLLVDEKYGGIECLTIQPTSAIF
jgi:hypothetical protein